MPEFTGRFLVDDHLRRLSRWLRSAGLDAVWEREIADRELYRRSWATYPEPTRNGEARDALRRLLR